MRDTLCIFMMLRHYALTMQHLFFGTHVYIMPIADFGRVTIPDAKGKFCMLSQLMRPFIVVGLRITPFCRGMATDARNTHDSLLLAAQFQLPAYGP